MELSKKPSLTFKGERAHCLPVGKHTAVPAETTLPEKSSPCWKWGEIFHAGANLEALSCTMCPWGSVPLGVAEAWPRNTTCYINHW